MSYYKSYDRDRTLPNPGRSPLGPRLIKRSDHEAIIACTDFHALAMLRGYLQSYGGVMGLLVASAVATLGAVIYAEDLLALITAVVFVACAGITIQVRRRAVQWLSIVDARMGELQGGVGMEYSMRVGGDFAPTGLSLSLFGRDSRAKDA
jgi:hypothetical protein